MASSPKKGVAENITHPDWLPDWRDVSQYPDVKKTFQTQWAWEFLRRNPEYQKQWQETIVPWLKPDGGFDSDAATEASHKAWSQKLIYDLEYRKKWEEFQRKWPVDVTKSNEEVTKILQQYHYNPDFNVDSAAFMIPTPIKELEDRFGFNSLFLLSPSMPSSESMDGVRFTNNLGWVISYDPVLRKDHPLGVPYEITVPVYKHNQTFVFDLELPIEPQIKVAKGALKARQKFLKAREKLKVKTPRNSSTRHFQRYLRLLDGQAVGASYAEMGKILFPRDNDPILKVRDSLNAAERLRDTDYRFIPRPSVK